MSAEEVGAGLRIGITMRVGHAVDYVEPRDVVAHDWYRFIADAFPAAKWMLLPNLGEESVAFAAGWGITGLILTGGDDIGVEPRRDASERALLDHAIDHDLPALGICRGLQLMVKHFGGRVAHDASGRHVATDHAVVIGANEFGFEPGAPIVVNSFHDNVILSAGELQPFATDEQGHIEAAYSPQHRLAGLMWHPERNRPAHPHDLGFVRRLLGN